MSEGQSEHMASEVPFDCQTCGACCYVSAAMLKTQRRDYVYIDQTDELTKPRHRKLIREVATYAGGRKWVLNVTEGDEARCAQLVGEVGVDIKCGIYEMRPRTCRWFQAGTQKCVDARLFKGLPVPDDFVPIEVDPWEVYSP